MRMEKRRSLEEALVRKRAQQQGQVSLVRSGEVSSSEALAAHAVASVFRPVSVGSFRIGRRAR